MKLLYGAVAALLLADKLVDALGQTTSEMVPANKKEIPYIQCQVCTEVTNYLSQRIKYKRSQLPKYKKFGQEAIIEAVENACDPEKPEGEWIRRFDIVLDKNDSTKLRLEDQDGQTGECHKECRTIAKACEKVIGDNDMELSDLLFADASYEELSESLCYDWTDVCASKKRKSLKGREDEEYVVMTEEQVQMEKMMRELGHMGGYDMMGGMGDMDMDMDGMDYGMDPYGDYGFEGMDGFGGMEGFDVSEFSDAWAEVEEKTTEGSDSDKSSTAGAEADAADEKESGSGLGNLFGLFGGSDEAEKDADRDL